MNYSTEEELREKEEFKKFIAFLLERSSYSWEDHHLQAINTLKELKKLKNYASGDQEKAKEIIRNDKINLFTSALLENEKQLEKFPTSTLEEIRDITGLTKEETKTIIYHYRYYKGIHGYLYKKKINGEYIPEDNSQLKQFLMLERPDFMIELNKDKQEEKRKEKPKENNPKEKQKKLKNEQRDHLRKTKTWQI